MISYTIKWDMADKLMELSDPVSGANMSVTILVRAPGGHFMKTDQLVPRAYVIVDTMLTYSIFRVTPESRLAKLEIVD